MSKDQVVFVLARCVDDNNRGVACSAMQALRKLRACPDSLVPKLVEKFPDAGPVFKINVAWVLGDKGDKAIVALPELLTGVNDPDARVSSFCRDAIFKIAPELLPVDGD